ncbi:Nitrogen permease regulator 3 [Friedmanniomyces endolithicus]|uniref:Nitrogen permease regulator 3 n=1 Tax=Friedmanniomyces endolithicus TaxID=329885 RepID=A0AAN6H0A4_9PEZI|nr:Nitrogen permease regulator 3 [Friedmanniomyces endolithicus]KAK0772019.1 Nitrogen permease regulator 3 [Friedmanniomyces endolithicus]KAK0779384.1 Nitrogen permease regulator 3 [Friedmanniomyces endolithicus]KAK0779982.1 Nitrogen permease regulator 3 [Friedmanniomyces endolithicus]KAK0831818.1 Nitrogen permease regulator 3 [Friedmanniomyces endolithicus]
MDSQHGPGEARLIAVLLITRSRSGPRLVFHYPPVPQAILPRRATDAAEDDASDLESDAGAGDDDPDRILSTHRPLTAPLDLDSNRGLESDIDANRDASSSSGDLLGYSVDSLERLLSPGRWAARKKFEICLNGITFLGHPMYAREDGEWGPKSATGRRRSIPAPSPCRDGDGQATAETTNITITAPGSPAKAFQDYTHMPDSLDSRHAISLGTSMESTSTASGLPAEQMAMFQVVFALRSDQQTYAAAIHEHVAKKLSKALHHCQMQHDYVSLESRKILALKSKTKQNQTSPDDLHIQLVEHSELAWALKEVYEKIAVNDVAGIRLNGTQISLHIPQDRPPTTPSSPPLTLHSALLLLEDKEALLNSLSHPEASPLAHFIRSHTPTKPLLKLATNLNIPSNEILYLSHHLIKWRKARAILPLHPRNTYVLHHEAPIDKLVELIPIYAARFAAVPTLPQMIKVLSGKPMVYGLLIPSRDHREPYMEILAFLDRHGFVARLQTFGWLRVGSGDEQRGESERAVSGVSLLSPHLRPVEDDEVSVASERTVVTTLPAEGSGTRQDDGVLRERLILDPADPSTEEGEAVDRIMDSLADTELRERLPQMLKYFDGEHALEDIAVREDLKRAKVEEWIAMLQTEGHLVTFRAI